MVKIWPVGVPLANGTRFILRGLASNVYGTCGNVDSDNLEDGSGSGVLEF